MVVKAAYLFLAPGAHARMHRRVVRTPEVEFTAVGVADCERAERAVVSLLNEGVAAIVLCDGFDHTGAARIVAAAAGRAAVGVIETRRPPRAGPQERRAAFAPAEAAP